MMTKTIGMEVEVTAGDLPAVAREILSAAAQLRSVSVEVLDRAGSLCGLYPMTPRGRHLATLHATRLDGGTVR